MKFDPAFMFLKISPPENGQAQVNGVESNAYTFSSTSNSKSLL